jgi:hypothetical protein
MDNNAKMTIVAKDGTALIGNHFHTLVDESHLLFTTDDLASFKAYLAEDREPILGTMSIYYSEGSVIAMRDEININTQVTAKCTISETSYIEALRKLNNKAIPLEGAEKTMLLFRPFSGVQGKEILDFCKSAHIESVINIDREKGNSGDYQFSLTRKKSGKDQFVCPESISFKVPILKNIAEERAITFETSFDYENVGDKVEMTFTFSNIDIDNIIAFNKREILDGLLKDLPFKKYWGNASVIALNDAWKYKANPLTGH